MSERFTKGLKWALWAALALVMLPLMLAAFYNRPSADDYVFLRTVTDVMANGGVWALLKNAVQYMIDNYLHWSGMFTPMFWGCIVQIPTAIDYRIAWYYPMAYMLLLAFACLRLGDCAGKLLKASKDASRCAGLMLAIAIFLLTDGVAEGYYWNSGAMVYTAMFSLCMLLFAGLLSWYSDAPQGLGPRQGLRPGLYCLGFLAVSGGNFGTSTLSIIFYGYFILYMLLKKDRRYYLALPFLFLLGGYLAAVLAPGNAVRQSLIEKPGIIEAFIAAFREAVLFFGREPKLYVLALLFLPIGWTLASKARCDFKRPWLVLIGSYLALAGNIFPAEFSMGTIGPWRMMNTHFFLLCIMLFVNIVYLMGWAQRRFALAGKAKKAFAAKWLCIYYVAASLLFGLCACDLELRSGRLAFNCWLPTVKAASFLRDGTLANYAQTYDAIVEEAKAHPGEALTIEDVPNVFLFHSAFGTDEDTKWLNDAFCLYYGLTDIVIAED